MTQNILKQLLVDADISCSDEQAKILFAYLELLLKWNKAFNLSAINDLDKMMRLHIVDSASLITFIKGDNILDVGTGAGLPGLVLAILMPNSKFTLLDSNNKKIRFLRQCLLELPIDNVILAHSRIEDFQAKYNYNSVICRAFSSVNNFVNVSKKYLAPDGIILLMKAKLNESISLQLKTKIHKISANNMTRQIVEIKNPDL